MPQCDPGLKAEAQHLQRRLTWLSREADRARRHGQEWLALRLEAEADEACGLPTLAELEALAEEDIGRFCRSQG